MIEPHEIATRLTSDPLAVCHALGLSGKKEGNDYKVEVGSHGKAIVCLKGAKAGLVLFTGGSPTGKEGGDMLSLCHAVEGNFKRGLAWAKGYLGIDDSRELDPVQQHRIQEENRKRHEASQKAQERRNASKVETANGIWNASVAIAGTPGEAYFRHRVSGLHIDHWPEALRFNERCLWDSEGAREYHPAVVCRVDDSAGQLTAIWRIFIKPDGSGKADLSPNKMGFGPAGGGAVRLWPSRDGVVAVCEGVETALGVHMMTGLPVWPLLSTSGMIGFETPFEIVQVRAFPDGDVPKRNSDGKWMPSPGMNAAEKMCGRLREEGTEAIVERSPGKSLDYLDLWNKVYGQQQRRVL